MKATGEELTSLFVKKVMSFTITLDLLAIPNTSY